MIKMKKLERDNKSEGLVLIIQAFNHRQQLPFRNPPCCGKGSEREGEALFVHGDF